MTRRHVDFPCSGNILFGSLDQADGAVGLLIVSGGNEIRSGAFASQSRLAVRIAAAGFPVFRFDRSGIGDSGGENRGFRESGPDILAACRAFRLACPKVERLVAFGNCDASSALMLNAGSEADALVLANPWTFDADESEEMPPEAVRARYADKLTNPREWVRLLRGGVSLRKLAAGLMTALRPAAPPSSLLQELRQGLAAFAGPSKFLVSGRDRTGQAFRSTWGADERITVREKADHAFSAGEDSEWLIARLVAVLDEQAGQLDVG